MEHKSHNEIPTALWKSGYFVMKYGERFCIAPLGVLYAITGFRNTPTAHVTDSLVCEIVPRSVAIANTLNGLETV